MVSRRPLVRPVARTRAPPPRAGAGVNIFNNINNRCPGPPAGAGAYVSYLILLAMYSVDSVDSTSVFADSRRRGGVVEI